MFDFDEIVNLRKKYEIAKHHLDANEDPLFNAIKKNKNYKHKYALLSDKCLEKYKNTLIETYHIDIIVKIASPSLEDFILKNLTLEDFTLVHLNKSMPSKILMGEFKGEKGTSDFNDFLDHISKFVNDKDAEINRDDINIIESSEFDISYIHPSYYTKQGTITRNEIKAKIEQERKLHALDFNEVVKLRQSYPLGCQLFHTEDSLLDAILDDKYPYEYALLHGRCLEKNKKKFFARYHPDVMIKIGDPGLHHFILVHLNTKSAKTLMGMFGDAFAIGSTFESLLKQAAKSYLEVEFLNHFIGEHKKDFYDFQDDISRFVNGDDINRNDMNIIKYSEFDIKYINPYYYCPLGIEIRNKLSSDARRFLQNRGDINDDIFDFTEAIRLRMKYPHGTQYASGEEDALLNAILNNEYTYKYALLNARWLEKNRKRFFNIYHPDVMIRIFSRGLDHFILVHLNTTKPSKVLMGEFEGKIVSDEISEVLEFMWLADLEVDMLSCYIREYEGGFCDFQDNILKFLKDDKIDRDDMNIIEYDEFNIYDIYPGSYIEQNMIIKNKEDEKYHKFLKEHGDIDGFDFNKIWWLRVKYSVSVLPFDEPKDYLFDAVEDGIYKYEYALLDKNWLEYNKEKFFAIYHPDVMIKIILSELEDFILVHLNTAKPSKILIGEFIGNVYAKESFCDFIIKIFYNKKKNNHIRKYEESFCDFQSNILKFLNGNNDINRDDMSVIKYDEFDINHIDPFYYSKEKEKIDKLMEEYCNSGDIHTFDFNKIVAFRLKYLDSKKLFDAIQNNEYAYKYVLLKKDWLEEYKKMFFSRYHPDIIISIDSTHLDQYFIVNLNTTKPTKILTGIFEGNAFALDAVLSFEGASLYDYIGARHEEDFCDFLDNISRFVNDKNAEINRDDINVIESSEFDIDYIHPSYYTKQGTITRNEMKAKREQEKKLHAIFDFNKVVEFRQSYPLGCRIFHTEDSLLDAILDDKYPYEYALLHGCCLEKNKEKFFAKYYPNVMIKIANSGLHHFLLVRLNTTKPAKILMGMFFKDAYAIGSTFETLMKEATKSYLGVDFLKHFIGEYKKEFCDFQDDISKFVNGNDIKRSYDMNIIKYSEFDIKYINPYYYCPQGIEIRNELTKMRRFLQNHGDIHDDSFDFTEVIRLRMKYPCGAKYASGEEDALLNAILNNEYTYKYALISIQWLEKNRKRFFNIYHPDVMIKIVSPGLDHFILVHLNTAKSSKILMGEFKGKIIPDDISVLLKFLWYVDLGVDMLYHYIREYRKEFCDFQDNILKFLNDKNAKINRDDMNIIEYDEFNIYCIYPEFYTEQSMRIKKEIDEKYHKFLKEHEDTDGFDFNKTMWLRLKYSYSTWLFDEPRDGLFDAIEDGVYKYEYALLDKNWLEYNKEKFFARYHPDVIISIKSRILINFTLVHLNTAKPSKILTGIFKENAYALDKDPNSKVPHFHDYIGEHEKEFCGFQDNISKFINGNNDINRDDMRVIEYDEFDIDLIDPFYYSKKKEKIYKSVEECFNNEDIAFDFNKIVAFRLKEEYSNPKDLFDAIQNNEYKYKYVLLEKDWLEENKDMFFARYHPNVIINIKSSIFLMNYILVHLNTNIPTKILTGVFEGNAYALNEVLGFEIVDLSNYIGKHEENFNDFLDNISRFLNDKNAEINRDDINVIEYDEFKIDDNIHPLYYSKQAIKIRNEIEEKDYKVLTDHVDVIDGPIVSGIRAKYLNENNFVYPLKYDDIKEEELPKAIKIQKEDIIYPVHAKDKNFYLYNLDNNDVYVDTEYYKILRCKDKKYTPYIVNYLNNKKMSVYLSVNIMYLEGRIIHSNINHFDKIKVINPTEYMLYIADETQKFKMYPEKIKLSEMNKIIREAHQIEHEKTFIQIAIDCIIENLHDLKLEALEDIINNDLKELDICHEKGAYKSAVILCGSILEAFLLDWLAEYEEKDDISEVIKIEEFEKEEYLELEKIIDKIEDIIKPYWKEKAEKADNIRDMRNMVHPKKYIKQSNKINKEECKKIIDDLKDIIVTRRFYKR